MSKRPLFVFVVLAAFILVVGLACSAGGDVSPTTAPTAEPAALPTPETEPTAESQLPALPTKESAPASVLPSNLIPTCTSTRAELSHSIRQLDGRPARGQAALPFLRRTTKGQLIFQPLIPVMSLI